ncbi:HD domain-containing protein [Allohahella marinimesophila]|uniref:HD domain-containing protein n=1 Tax=Allohahella marinimesophila TaxID=1054972 RepID=A0ABP7Q3X5_9GAMM
MNFITQDALLDQLLAEHSSQLGADLRAYTNHCYRVFNLALLMTDPQADTGEKLSIACAFHDLGIWTDNTFDYIDPSVDLAQAYLEKIGKPGWSDEVSQMISEHHKVTSSSGSDLVEKFRQADWIDVTMGMRSFGIDRLTIRALYEVFPTHGFHKRLAQLSAHDFVKHPLKPLPMFRW